MIVVPRAGPIDVFTVATIVRRVEMMILQGKGGYSCANQIAGPVPSPEIASADCVSLAMTGEGSRSSQ